MIDLTVEQSQALKETRSLRVRDPESERVYVLVTAEQYEQMQDLLAAGPFSEDERRTILKGVWDRAGWDDPRMDDYDALPIHLIEENPQ